MVLAAAAAQVGLVRLVLAALEYLLLLLVQLLLMALVVALLSAVIAPVALLRQTQGQELLILMRTHLNRVVRVLLRSLFRMRSLPHHLRLMRVLVRLT